MHLAELARGELYRFDGAGYVGVIAYNHTARDWSGVTYWDAGERAEFTRKTFNEVLGHFVELERALNATGARAQIAETRAARAKGGRRRTSQVR